MPRWQLVLFATEVAVAFHKPDVTGRGDNVAVLPCRVQPLGDGRLQASYASDPTNLKLPGPQRISLAELRREDRDRRLRHRHLGGAKPFGRDEVIRGVIRGVQQDQQPTVLREQAEHIDAPDRCSSSRRNCLHRRGRPHIYTLFCQNVSILTDDTRYDSVSSYTGRANSRKVSARRVSHRQLT